MKKLIFALLFIPSLVMAGGDHTRPSPVPESSHSSRNIAIGAILVGAVVCIVNDCWKSDPPPKQEGSIVPPNANPGLMGVEIK